MLLMLLLDVEAGTPLAVGELKVVLAVVEGVEGDDAVDEGAAVVVVPAGGGMSRGAEERKGVES